MSEHRTHRARVVVAATTALALSTTVLLGCSSSGASSSPTSTTPSTSTTIAALTLPPSTLPAQATTGYPSSYDAVQHLVEAWEAGDRITASQGADAVAVYGIWETPPGELDQRGCAQTYDPALTEGGCILRRADQTGALQVNTERRAIGWVVSSAVYAPN